MAYIVLMGVQGAGKGTQADILKTKYDIPHVTTGGMFRSMPDTPLGREVQALMAAYKLISDEITIQVVRERLTQLDAANGVILDGFPRTKPQAEALDQLLTELGGKVAVVPYLKLDKDIAIDRIVNRWVCSQDSNHSYNLKTIPPQVAGRCDIDDAPLIQRPDDTREGAEKRIGDFFQQTAPLLDYYRERHVLREIDADQPVEKVTADLIAAIDEAIQSIRP
ncbi:MAG: nucleoside monophosphate kinase [Chloroflexota bacterium]